jgi:hypothetical protein
MALQPQKLAMLGRGGGLAPVFISCISVELHLSQTQVRLKSNSDSSLIQTQVDLSFLKDATRYSCLRLQPQSVVFCEALWIIARYVCK